MNEERKLKLLESYDSFDYEVSVAQGPKTITEDDKGNTIEIPGVKKVMMKGILQKADTLNQNGRIYPLSVLEREVRNYQKFILENRAVGELDHPDACVPMGTDVLTRDGWKKIEDIADDEVVATINPKTEHIEYQRILQKIDQPFEGELYRFSNARTYDVTVTPNHRILMWDRSGTSTFMKAEEMFSAFKRGCSKLSHSALRRSGTWVGEEPEVLEIANKVVDAKLWAAFLGIYLAEGHCSGIYVEDRQKMHDVVITQNKGPVCDAIAVLLQHLPWKFDVLGKDDQERRDFCIKDAALHAHLIQLGGSREKCMPRYVKTWGVALLEPLLEWMLAGDGRHRYGYKHEGTIPEYCTTSPKLADDVYEIMLKLGHGATIHTYQPSDRPSPDFNETGRMILSENSAPMNIVYQHSSKNICLDRRFMNATTVPYVGRVYCVVTPNQTWLMRQNGNVCWTGNSVVNLKNVSHIIREAHIEKGVVYGTVEVLNTPSGKILQSLVESGVKLGISSRGVGSTKKQGDYNVVQDDFQLICWDYVSEPSTPSAFMIPEGKSISTNELKALLNKSDRIDRILNEILSGRDNK